MKNVIKFIIVFIVLIIVGSILFYYRPTIAEEFIHWKGWGWYEWPKLIITTLTGGAIGGLITYSWISPFEKRKEARAIQREVNKDQREKKERCTKALLATQMALNLQMASIKGIENFTNQILDLRLGEKLLVELFENSSNMSDQTDLLYSLYKQKKYDIQILIPLMHHIISDHTKTISLPSEIFEMPFIYLPSKIDISQLSEYFQKLSSLNLRYASINSLLTHHNETKKIVTYPIILKNNFNPTGITDDEFRQALSAIPAIFALACQIKELVNKYLKKSEDTFSLTNNYIKLLAHLTQRLLKAAIPGT